MGNWISLAEVIINFSYFMKDCLESCGLAISSLCQFRFFVLKWMEENFVEKQKSVFQRHILIGWSRLKQKLNIKKGINIKKSQKILQIFQSIASQTHDNKITHILRPEN